MESITHPITDRQSWLEMRKTRLGASDMGAVFGCSPHKTALQLWAEMTGRLPAGDRDNVAMRRGRIFESAVAAGLREAHPEWHIKPALEYTELPSHRIGCTPDFYAWNDSGTRYKLPFLIQAKTVLRSVWEEEWTPAPPAHYLVQIQTEMLVTGIPRCLLAAMVLDGREFPIPEYMFEADEEFQAEILKASARFWECVDRGIEPKLKPAQDGDTLSKLHPNGQNDPVLALHGDEDFVVACREYHDLGKQIKALEEQRASRATVAMSRLRNHAKAEAQGYKVNWTNVPEVRVAAHVKKAHRRFTVTKIKEQA